MNPEEQHRIYMREYASNRKRESRAMAFCKFVIDGFHFEIAVRIWQDDDWEYNEWSDFCKNIVKERLELNNSTFKTIADSLFEEIAMELPSREIWIKISQGEDISLTVKYS